VGPEGRKRPATVSLFEIPGCFAGPIEEPQTCVYNSKNGKYYERITRRETGEVE
jgi:hypothetical protein